MATDFYNPISKAVRPEDTAKTLSKYRNSQEKGNEKYTLMVKAFYDLITDFIGVRMGSVISLRTDEGRRILRGIHCRPSIFSGRSHWPEARYESAGLNLHWDRYYPRYE